jgi:hypothetical protein
MLFGAFRSRRQKPSAARIGEAAKGIEWVLRTYFREHDYAYSSKDGAFLGFLLISSLRPHEVYNRFVSPHDPENKNKIIPSPIRVGDTLMVIEVGLENCGEARAITWIDHHHPLSTKRAARPQAAYPEPKGQSQLASQLAGIKDKLGKKT